MGFDEQVKTLIEQADIPERLSPDNIALMLKEKTAEKKRKEIKQSAVSVKSKNRAVAFRSTAAVAACIALTFGIVAVVDEMNTPAVNQELTLANKASDYHDVYSVIQDTIINNPADDSEDSGFAQLVNDNEGYAAITNIDNKDYLISSDKENNILQADTAVTDGTNLYCIADGSVYFISADNGKMTEILRAETADKKPVGIYIEGNKLAVISNNTVEVPYEAKVQETTATTENAPADSTEATQTMPSLPETVTQNNTVVDIYNISDRNTPKLENSYKQNGTYISSSMSGTSLYIATNYSNFRTKPLDSEQDLDNYIPAYYINDSKYYVDVADITIPSKASSAYTIVSGLNVEGNSPFMSVKAVLASGKSAYFTEGGLYVAGNVSSSGKTYVGVTKFAVSDGMVAAPAFISLDGTYSQELTAMKEYSGSLVISTATENSGSSRGINLYVISEDFTSVLGSASQNADDSSVDAVTIDGDRVYIITKQGTPKVISLADKTKPQLMTEYTDSKSAYLYKYNDSLYLGFSADFDADGNQTGVRATMYRTDGAMNFTEVSSADMNGVLSAALCCGKIDSRSLIIDSQNGIIGVPTVCNDTYGNKNMYYVFSYGETAGFTPIGSLEYTDLSEKYEFRRAVRTGDTLYVFADGRIVSAQAADLKVIETMEIK